MLYYIAIIVCTIGIIIAFWWAERYEDEGVEEFDYSDYSKALDERTQAEQNFDYADEEHIDLAIVDLNITKWKVGNEIKKLRIKKLRLNNEKR